MIKQFLIFGIVGVSSTIVNYLIYLLLTLLGVHYNIAYAVGFLVGVPNSYFWSSRFVFKEDKTKEKRVWWKVLIKTYASYSLGFVLNSVLLVLWIDIINIGSYMGFIEDICTYIDLTSLSFISDSRALSEVVAPIINIFITMPINFAINKLWAYRQKERIIHND